MTSSRVGRLGGSARQFANAAFLPSFWLIARCHLCGRVHRGDGAFGVNVVIRATDGVNVVCIFVDVLFKVVAILALVLLESLRAHSARLLALHAARRSVGVGRYAHEQMTLLARMR
jgi:hypothetical protein